MPELLFDQLPVATLVCDRDGALVRFNSRAVALWARTPRQGDSAERLCGFVSKTEPDGTWAITNQSPLREVLRTGRPIYGQHVVVARADGQTALARADIQALRDDDGGITGAVACLVEISAQRRTLEGQTVQEVADKLRATEARYLSLFNSIDQGFCVIEVLFDEAGKPMDYVFLEVNAAFEAQTGLRDSIGRRMRQMATAHEQHWFDIYGRIALTGKPERFEQHAAALSRWYEVYAFRIDAPELHRVAVLFNDITPRKQAEGQHLMLLREMNHRVKNLLTIANGIVALSARSAQSPDEMVQAVRGRLSALAVAHDLARPNPDGKASGGNLSAMIRTILSPYIDPQGTAEGNRLVLRGPEVAVGETVVTGLALVLHELATNAAKYGALASTEGRIETDWSVAAGQLVLTWSERGGPAVTGPPENTGFGSVLARQGVEDQLGGRFSSEWRPEGLVVRLTLPLSAGLSLSSPT